MARGDADTASELLAEAREIAASAGNLLLDLDVHELSEAIGTTSTASGGAQA